MSEPEREMITDVADYFAMGCGRCERFNTADCSTKRWSEGLANLRGICQRAGLEETAKWGHPVYMHAGRNVAIIGAFQGNYRLGFFNSALMKDPEGLMVKQGPNTQHPDQLQFESNEQVEKQSSVIEAYLKEAMGYAEAGIKAPKTEAEYDLPEELIEAMDADPELAEGFHDLTPGRKRSYAINLNGAKKSETRIARIAKFRDHIIAGKGANER